MVWNILFGSKISCERETGRASSAGVSGQYLNWVEFEIFSTFWGKRWGKRVPPTHVRTLLSYVRKTPIKLFVIFILTHRLECECKLFCTTQISGFREKFQERLCPLEGADWPFQGLELTSRGANILESVYFAEKLNFEIRTLLPKNCRLVYPGDYFFLHA